MSTARSLVEAIESRRALVGIVGLGYVGLPRLLRVEEQGFRVTGFDTDAARISSLRAGHTYLRHVAADRVHNAFSRRASASGELDQLADRDVILVCVPTPLGRRREPALDHVLEATDSIGRTLRPGQLVVIESTIYPGATRAEVLPRLSRSGLECGRDFFLAFSPERENPGSQPDVSRTIPRLIGAVDGLSLKAAASFYGAIVDHVVPVDPIEVAEASKLVENIFRAVNVALVNELKMILGRMNVDVWAVIEAAGTKPFGYMPFYPGPGIGGHCIPIDPYYLTWRGAECGATAPLIELAGEINHAMPGYVAARTAGALGTQGKSLAGAKILVLGVAYKAEVEDDRESPAYALIDLLDEGGAELAYCDPHVPVASRGRARDLALRSVPCTSREFARYDALVLVTPHDAFRDPGLYRGAKLVVDTRNFVGERPGGPIVVRA